MDFIRPTTWPDAVAAKAKHPDAVPIAGGTDLMVGLNSMTLASRATGSGGPPPPAALLDLTGLVELTEWAREDGHIRIGANVTYSRIIDELAGDCPGLAAASRTVGSPQIRNRATVAGNLGTASPAGDAHPPLLAARAVVEAESVRGRRDIPIDDFFLGVKRNALAADELIRAVRMPVAPGPQQFAKVGPRNAMVIAVCTVAVALDPGRRTVGTAHRLGRPDAAAGRRRRGAGRRPSCRGAPVSRSTTTSCATSGPGPRPRRRRSTTCAARPSTAATPWPCWPAAHCAGPGPT